MADKEMMERAEHVLYKTYNRFPVVFDHGKGVRLYDTEGQEYLDFGAGIAVMGLGYGDEEYTQAVKEPGSLIRYRECPLPGTLCAPDSGHPFCGFQRSGQCEGAYQ